jgi:hypothetical protein
MVNLLGEEKNGRFKNNVLGFYWLKQRAHTGRYVPCITSERGSVFARSGLLQNWQYAQISTQKKYAQTSKKKFFLNIFRGV